MFDKLPETIRLMEKLEASRQGDELTPSQMKAILGCDSNGSGSPGYRKFYSVARHLEHQSGGLLCWRWIRGERVYRCLRNHEMPKDVSNRTVSIRRRARRNVMIGNAIEMAELSPEEQRCVQVQVVLNSAIQTLASRNTIKKMEKQMPSAVIPTAADLMRQVRTRETSGTR